jgi:hypothetical protein|tara:strand:+ start:60 stop:323 length:264 start_codon:yes stop_codon:yes gene_type:complete
MKAEDFIELIEQNRFDKISKNGMTLIAERFRELQSKQLTLTDVVKSLPNDEQVKAWVDGLPYYGSCTTEYNEGFEDGVKWLKEQIAK